MQARRNGCCWSEARQVCFQARMQTDRETTRTELEEIYGRVERGVMKKVKSEARDLVMLLGDHIGCVA